MSLGKNSIILFVALVALLKPCCAKQTIQLYDYIIVGGGTCGLVVANRLSELPDVSVLIIEAGASVLNNSNVTDTSLLGTLPVGTSIDWQYKNVSQTYSDNQQHTMNAGKAIGGTSTINGQSELCIRFVVQTDTQGERDGIYPRRRRPNRLMASLGERGLNLESTFPLLFQKRALSDPGCFASQCRRIT